MSKCGCNGRFLCPEGKRLWAEVRAASEKDLACLHLQIAGLTSSCKDTRGEYQECLDRYQEHVDQIEEAV